MTASRVGKFLHNREAVVDRLFEGTAVALAAGLMAFAQGDLKGLDFILRPVSSLIYWSTGSAYSYIEGSGYTHQSLGINIGAQCSGINFLTMLFLMLVFCFIPKQRGIMRKLAAFIAFGALAYNTGILANTSRILVSVLILNHSPLASAGQDQLIHLSIGVMLYFTYLLLAYNLVNAILNRKGVPGHEIPS